MALEDGVSKEDGTVEDPCQDVETYYAPLESIAEVEDPDGDYLRITGDNGMTNVEIRVPAQALGANGWIRVRAPGSEAPPADPPAVVYHVVDPGCDPRRDWHVTLSAHVAEAARKHGCRVTEYRVSGKAVPA